MTTNGLPTLTQRECSPRDLGAGRKTSGKRESLSGGLLGWNGSDRQIGTGLIRAITIKDGIRPAPWERLAQLRLLPNS